MGVRGLTTWIHKLFPLIKQSLAHPSAPRFDTLFIDFNSIYYQALSTYPNLKEDDSEIVFKEALRILDLIVNIVSPGDLIYIAMDGVSSESKFLTRKMRRYEKSNEIKPGYLNLCHFTVGTEFVNGFIEQLTSFIEKKRNEECVWKGKSIYLSSHNEPGEGENKIFGFIRGWIYSEQYNPNFSHAVYSPDSDVILLSLMSHEKNISIIRDNVVRIEDIPDKPFINSNVYGLESFEIISISMLRDCLSRLFQCSVDVFERSIEDFVVLCYLMPNDCFQGFPNITIYNGYLDLIVDNYKLIRKKRPSEFIVSNSIVNLPFLVEILISLGTTDLSNSTQKDAFLFFDYIMSNFQLIKSGKEIWRGKSFSIRNLSVNSLKLALPKYAFIYEETIPFDPLFSLLAVSPRSMSHLLPKELSSIMFDPSPAAYMYETINHRIIDIGILMDEYDKQYKFVDEHFKELNRSELTFCYLPNQDRTTKPIAKGFSFMPKCNQKTIINGIPHLASPSINISLSDNVYKLSCIEKRNTMYEFNKTDDVLPVLGSVILVGVPYISPALLVCAFDRAKEVGIDENNEYYERKVSDFSKIDQKSFPFNGRVSSSLVLAVRMIRFLSNDRSSFVYSNELSFFSNKVCLPSHYNNYMSNYIFKSPICDLGSRIIICNGEYKGCIGIIHGINSDDTLDVLAEEHSSSITKFNTLNDWYSEQEVLDQLEIPKQGLEKLISNQIFLYSKSKKYCISYPLYSYDKNFYIPSLLKVVNGSFSIHKSLYADLKTLLDISGNLKKIISSPLITKTLFNEEELFSSNVSENTNQLIEWLKVNSPRNRFSFFSITYDSLSLFEIRNIEEQVIKVEKTQTKERIIKNIKWDDIIWKKKSYKSYEKPQNILGERVVSISSTSPAEFGMKGTVIMSSQGFVGVLFDDEMELGTFLGNILESRRGLILPIDELLFH